MITDMNVLYDAFRAAMKGSSWKYGPQKFEKYYLPEIVKLKRELESGKYKPSPTSEFTINERGHIRRIHGGAMRDRVVEHALCDTVINPAITPYLIYNNGASRKGKGVSFTRQALVRDLHNYFLKHGNNDGWVGLIDFSKFYDNIRHDKVREMFRPLMDDFHFEIFETILDTFKVDVSYMTDEEYAVCMDHKYNSVEYYETIPKELRTGEKFMPKSLNIGNQISQSIGIFYPTPIDNFITNVKGFSMYHRYMDDMVLIHPDRDYIRETIDEVRQEAKKLGLFINDRKTHITKMSETFTFLQRKYFVTDTGKVVIRITPKAVTRERRKLKAYKRILDRGVIDYQTVENAAKSWMGANVTHMSKLQIKNIKTLYKELFGKELVWKTQQRSSLQTVRPSPHKHRRTASSQKSSPPSPKTSKTSPSSATDRRSSSHTEP